jgi:subtilase family serine protease
MYTIGNNPNPWNGNGTSAVAPLYAGLLAVINAALGYRAGFINPLLYSSGGTICRDVDPTVVGGPNNNGLNGAAGYPARTGWDACTGWGTIDGQALLNALLQEASQGANAGQPPVVTPVPVTPTPVISHSGGTDGGSGCGIQIGLDELVEALSLVPAAPVVTSAPSCVIHSD